MNIAEELDKLKAELQELRAEVARLKTREAALRPFLHVEEADNGESLLSIQCALLNLSNPDFSKSFQALLGTSEDGPYIWLCDKDQKPRVILQVEQNEPSIMVQTATGQPAVLLEELAPGGLGQVAVLANGHPRAVLKATSQNTGAVSVVHDDGHPRACLYSTEFAGGEVAVVTPDAQIGVKLGADWPKGGGGFVAVNHSNGQNAVFLANTGKHGVVMINKRDGQPCDVVPRQLDLD